jgi:hypothetical protein
MNAASRHVGMVTAHDKAMTRPQRGQEGGSPVEVVGSKLGGEVEHVRKAQPWGTWREGRHARGQSDA